LKTSQVSASADQGRDDAGRAPLHGWRRFWFEPEAPGPLGFCRILFFGYLLLRLAPGAATVGWAGVDTALWWPTHLFAVLHLGSASPGVLRSLDALWVLALILSCVGLFTGVSTVVALLVGTYVLGLPQCFGKVDHWSGLLIVAMLVLALARSGDAWSIDAWIAHAGGAGRAPGLRARASAASTGGPSSSSG